jgi:hypothetical protein
MKVVKPKRSIVKKKPTSTRKKRISSAETKLKYDELVDKSFIFDNEIKDEWPVDNEAHNPNECDFCQEELRNLELDKPIDPADLMPKDPLEDSELKISSEVLCINSKASWQIRLWRVISNPFYYIFKGIWRL